MSVPGTLYKAIGGEQAIDKIVSFMYSHVAKDPKLIPIFPKDLRETERKQRLFLTQFLGGPSVYTADRGHPMLRRRHLPFEITDERKDAWLRCMDLALDEAEIEEPYRSVIFKRIQMTAEHMVNTP